MSAVVGTLVRKGLVEQVPDRVDQRQKLIRMTAVGTKLWDELRADRSDRGAVVAAEIGDGLEIGHQTARQPHQFDVALGFPFEPAARRDAVQIAIEIYLQQRGLPNNQEAILPDGDPRPR